jgi:hypothetical protein
MGVRLYNPATGHFTSVDPVKGGSANAYDYANQDPANQLDPSGKTPFKGHARWIKSWERKLTKSQALTLARKLERAGSRGEGAAILVPYIPGAGPYVRIALEVVGQGAKGTAQLIRQNVTKRGATITVGLYYRPPVKVEPKITVVGRRLPDEVVSDILEAIRPQIPSSVSIETDPGSSWLRLQTPAGGSMQRCLGSFLTLLNRRAAVEAISKNMLDVLYLNLSEAGIAWPPETRHELGRPTPHAKVDHGRLHLSYMQQGRLVMDFPSINLPSSWS